MIPSFKVEGLKGAWNIWMTLLLLNFTKEKKTPDQMSFSFRK